AKQDWNRLCRLTSTLRSKKPEEARQTCFRDRFSRFMHPDPPGYPASHFCAGQPRKENGSYHLGFLRLDQPHFGGGDSQTFTVPSLLPDTMRWPLLLMATPVIVCVCPLSVTISCPVTAFHNLSV